MYVVKNKILVEEFKDDNVEQEQTPSGLYIASSGNPHNTTSGIVRDFGADVSFFDEPGETIMYLKSAGVPFVRDGKNYRVIEDDEIIAILSDDSYDLPESDCESCDA